MQKANEVENLVGSIFISMTYLSVVCTPYLRYLSEVQCHCPYWYIFLRKPFREIS